MTMEENIMVFRFKALSIDDDDFARDYELRYDSTLLDFHKLICDDLGFDREELSSFFLSNANWEKLQEFTLIDMEEDIEDGPMFMDSIILGQIIRQKHARLIYTFDILSDRGLFIELIKSHAGNPNIEYPIVALKQGEAPVQLGEEREGAIFGEMMKEFEDGYGDDDDYGFGEYDEYSSDSGYGNDYNDDYY